ncbi:glycosyltransferase [Specibacter sp. NPDC057265]|uniref:glycosyltransferase n=1 Tax=Specibacter sp. NPDC057265 TaxID=3346075 RepID=UPI003639D0BC
MSTLHNIRLAASTVLHHVADDPIVLALQLSRRLPAGLVQPVAKAVTQVMSRSSSAPALVACYVRGDLAGLEQKFRQAATHNPSANTARWAADVALGAGLPQWADTFLPLARTARRYSSTLARRRWYDGDMSGAVAALAGQGGAAGRQRERLAGELATFSGWEPKLSSVPMTPVSGRVMHFLTNSLPHTGSGYAQRSHSILAAQQAAGAQVLAVTRLGYPVQVGRILSQPQDEVEGVVYRRLIPATLARTADARLQQEAEALLQVALEFRPEVLHTTTHFVNGLVVGAVARALGIPWVYEVRGQLADTWASTRHESAKHSERYLAFQGAEASVMKAAGAVATLGTAMQASIEAQGIGADKIVLAPNAVGGDFLAEPGSPESARAALGLDPVLNYIGTVSSLVDYEGLDDLVAAFALLAPQFPRLRLLLVGGGTAAAALREQAARLGLAKAVIFPGRVPREQTSLYHQAMDIFVVPRKDLDVTRAVTPLKPVEALASGRTVVASDLPALREIVFDGVNGRLSAAGNPEALAATLAELLNDPAGRQRLGAKGRELVLETRTWGANAQLYADLYHRLRIELEQGSLAS